MEQPVFVTRAAFEAMKQAYEETEADLQKAWRKVGEMVALSEANAKIATEATAALTAERARFDNLLEKYHSLRQSNYAPRLPDERAVVPPVPEPEEQMVNAQRRMAIDAAMADLKAQGIPEGKAREEAERMIGSIFAPITADDLMNEGAY